MEPAASTAVAIPSPAEASPADERDGRSRYEVVSTLGRGATGTVYKAIDRELDEEIAIKVLHPHLSADVATVDQFKRELRLARRVNHPSVVQLYHFFRWQGQFAIAQEYIDGEPLTKAFVPPLEPSQILRLLRHICSALGAAHELGVVHRDLKPANILIDRRGLPRIVDFGLVVVQGQIEGREARLVAGTPAYLSPEQIVAPHAVDHRADVYALGVNLYYFATGKLPFAGLGKKATLEAHVNKRPLPPRRHNPALPAPLDSIILRCLAKDPDDRYGSVRDIHHAACSALAPDVAEAARKTRHKGSRGRVLVIEDDLLIREAISAVLSRRGVAVSTAKNGNQGLQAALRDRPDLIFCDLKMPVVDGKQFLTMLKANGDVAHIPVVILTGVRDRREMARTKEIGAALFINKPPQADVIDLVLDRFLPTG